MRQRQSISWALALMLVASPGGYAAGKAAPTSPLDLGISTTDSQILQLDPKLPGKYLWKIWAKGGSGVSASGGYQGTLNGVTALLFDKGVASAWMKAPDASGDSLHQTIVATGRVTVLSLKQPGTTLQADRMTWYAKTKQILATGNVIYHNPKNGVTMHVPSLTADTELKSVFFGKGNATLR